MRRNFDGGRNSVGGKWIFLGANASASDWLLNIVIGSGAGTDEPCPGSGVH